MTLLMAFWKRVDRQGLVYKNLGRCWLWKGTKNQSGRGQFIYKGKWYSGPRVAYEFLIGPLPKGGYVLHRCDNPSCVNPRHLFKGTQYDNMRDMVAKGRAADVKAEKNPNAKLSRDAAAEIIRRHKRWCPVNGTKALAVEFGVTPDRVQKVVNGPTCWTT